MKTLTFSPPHMKEICEIVRSGNKKINVFIVADKESSNDLIETKRKFDELFLSFLFISFVFF